VVDAEDLGAEVVVVVAAVAVAGDLLSGVICVCEMCEARAELRGEGHLASGAFEKCPVVGVERGRDLDFGHRGREAVAAAAVVVVVVVVAVAGADAEQPVAGVEPAAAAVVAAVAGGCFPFPINES